MSTYALSLVAFTLLNSLGCVRRPEITLDAYFGHKQASFQKISRVVLQEIAGKFESSPPANVPIRCTFSIGKLPRTTLESQQIRITLTSGSIETLIPEQLVFQLAHELGHVYLGTQVTNAHVESLAVALSFQMLDHMTIYWPAELGKIPNFGRYRLRTRDEMLEGLIPTVRVAVRNGDWNFVSHSISDILKHPAWLSEQGINSREGRAIQAAAALTLLHHGIDWMALGGFAHRSANGDDIIDPRHTPFAHRYSDDNKTRQITRSLCVIGLGC